MSKNTKFKIVREIEKFAKTLNVKVEFVQCQKHIQLFVEGVCVTVISNSRTDERYNNVFGKIRQAAKNING